MRFVDLHSHIIPKVDDGSQSIEESLDMLRMEAEQGAEVVFLTSHSDEAFNDVFAEYTRERYRELQERAKAEEIPVRLCLGSEIYLRTSDPGVADYTISLIWEGKVPTLNDSPYVLIEFDQSGGSIQGIEQIITKFVSAGFVPVIAHAERYRYLAGEDMPERISVYKSFRELGARIQINAYSVFQEENPDTKWRANQLVKCRYVDFIGSDAHRLNHRAPEMETGIRYLYETNDREYVDLIVYQNAMKKIVEREVSVRYA